MARIFHRSAAIVMALAMVIGTLAFGSQDVSAQCENGGTCAPGSTVKWGSAINIQNRGDAEATITIDFYRPDGSIAVTYPTNGGLELEGNASISIYVPAFVEGLASGQYSAVVNSTEQVNVSVNTGSTSNSDGPWAEFAYEGMGQEQAGTTLYFPLLQNKYFNFDSEMVIQNTGTEDATVSAKFFNQNGGQIATANLGTIKANAARTFTVGTFTTTPELPSGREGIFGAVVTSDQNITGIVNIWRSTPRTGVASYTGFTEGSTMLYAPAILVDYYDFISALTLQNVGTTNAQVTIDYVTSTGPIQRKFELRPNAARASLEFTDTAFPQGNQLISARITSTGGSLVGLISQSIPEDVRGQRATSPGGDFAAYALPSTPATSVSIPSVTSDYYGLFVAVNVQNTGDEAADITITYSDSPTCQGLTNKTRIFEDVRAGASVNIIHLGNNDLLPNNQRCATSAVVSSTEALVATIQQNTERSVAGYNDAKKSGDFLSAITGIVGE